MSKKNKPVQTFAAVKSALAIHIDMDSVVASVVDLDKVAMFEEAQALSDDADRMQVKGDDLQSAFKLHIKEIRDRASRLLRNRNNMKLEIQAAIAEFYQASAQKNEFQVAIRIALQGGNDQKLREDLHVAVSKAMWAVKQGDWDALVAEIEGMRVEIIEARKESPVCPDAIPYWEKATKLRFEALAIRELIREG